MSPEYRQCLVKLKEINIDTFKSDIFSLGIVILSSIAKLSITETVDLNIL